MKRDFLLFFRLFFRLKTLVRQGRFIFFYQPIYDLKTKKVIGVEALMRLKQGKNIIAPDRFIPFLEKTGKIKALSDFLLAQTLSDIKKIHRAGFKNIKLAINLSAVQLYQQELPDLIAHHLKASNLPHNMLECEITETSFIKNHPVQLDTLSRLEKTGVSLALDDFGSGYSSFEYLRKLHIQTLKIDQQFVKTLFDQPNNAFIVQAILQLGRHLNLTTIAEGIETPKQETWLHRNGCYAGQGFYFSKPMALDDLIAFLKHKK